MRSVEVARGRAGYGFTLSGQAPCVLSGVLRGSPADFVGLRAGDQIFAINEINVKRASHEDVVKLIGKCSGVLRLVIGEGSGHPEACSSDDEGGVWEGRGWLRPKLDSKALGINRAERVVEEMQSGGIFSMIFENPSLCSSGLEPLKGKQRSLSESAATWPEDSPSAVHPGLLSTEEVARMIHDDVFSTGPENPDSFVLDASILNVAMVVGYLGSIELPSTSSNLESDSLQAIRGCMRRLRAEQKIHSLVTMKVMHDRVLLCSDKACVVAEYPAEKLAFSAVCPDDRRFFGLVTMQMNDDGSLAPGEECALRTSCHVFMVDPDLFHHKIHQGIARRFGFACTADPDTSGCLEFPASSLPVLQFVSVLYRDMGELIEGVRARAFLDGDVDAQQNNSTSSNSDSGIGNFAQEEKSNRVLVVDLGGASSRHGPGSGGGWEGTGARSSQPGARSWTRALSLDPEGGALLEAGSHTDRLWDLSKPLGPASLGEGAPASLRSSVPPSKRGDAGSSCGLGQRWLPVHVLQEWQCGHASDQESYTDSTDGWSSVNCGTLPPPMSKIPADRYRVEGSFVQAPLSTQKRDWARKAFGMQNLFGPPRNLRKTKEDRKLSRWAPVTSDSRPWEPERSAAGSVSGEGWAAAFVPGVKHRAAWCPIRPAPVVWPRGVAPLVLFPRLCSQSEHSEDFGSGHGGSRFGRGIGLVQTSQHTSARRSFGRSKRFSITRSLDDLELFRRELTEELLWGEVTIPASPLMWALHGPGVLRQLQVRGSKAEGPYSKASSTCAGSVVPCPMSRVLPASTGPACSPFVAQTLCCSWARGGPKPHLLLERSPDKSATVSDGELTGADLKDCVSSNSLSSNASLPSVQSCRRLRERRVASWAVSFERLLQDPVGIRYFSDFLRKEFSEENILFWQACEYFNHVPAHDKKELSCRAREIFSKFLCSKATTPVNIDSQAQLADDILNAPHPDMFKEQQLQIFNLMKFDSYTRFLKSQLYQECILAEVEGRALPDAQQVPSSPASKRSIGSDHSSASTPKKLSGKSKSGRSLNEDAGDEDSEKKRKGAFFSWSRSRSTGRSQKKKEPSDHTQDALPANGSLCRRESQGSVSSTGSLDLPLVLHQDSSILASRDLRLEKRTLFRLDLVPINRSVGLKAKPTKPVTEVLRPVVAKYGLDLGHLLVRLSGEKEPLDLGAPISSLDGQRVVLEERDPTRGRDSSGSQLTLLCLASTDKQKGTPAKPSAAASSGPRNHSATGEERTLGKSNSIKIKGENGKNARDPRLSKREESIAKIGKKKYQKINLDEAEEFFELISKAQSNRADDQRGLLRKEDLVLPEFLRLPPGCTELALCSPAPAKGFSKRPETTGHSGEKVALPSDSPTTSPGSAQSPGSAHSPPGPPGATPPGQKAQEGATQVWRRQSREVEAGCIQTEDESGADLTLVGEGDISSPNSTLLPPPPSPQDAPGPPRPGTSGF
ncbi:Regulator of G-protein signaling 12 [Heterocephalus glaber]|uniref:Regulator of G-protein signaling 12 n=1 Tax=Heterocephalus glaber TaxID=10181 RepID=G5BZF4_HETGA|nr:Regulator of G-protein signaling 12 [Heterocephalus glaber]